MSQQGSRSRRSGCKEQTWGSWLRRRGCSREHVCGRGRGFHQPHGSLGDRSRSCWVVCNQVYPYCLQPTGTRGSGNPALSRRGPLLCCASPHPVLSFCHPLTAHGIRESSRKSTKGCQEQPCSGPSLPYHLHEPLTSQAGATRVLGPGDQCVNNHKSFEEKMGSKACHRHPATATVRRAIYMSLTFSIFKSHLQMPVPRCCVSDTCAYLEGDCSETCLYSHHSSRRENVTHTHTQ